jgi:glycolate oxidase iron-sulfur subunit
LKSASSARSIHTIDSVQHRIPLETLGRHGEGMARAVTTCVHCGFCLAACPTYKVLGEEMDSPRGRIVLMKQALEGDLALDETRPYIDRCLGCLSCETACPSGVRYRELLVPFRERLERAAPRSRTSLIRRATLAVLESPAAFRAAFQLARLVRPLSRLLPSALQSMLHLMPRSLPARDELPEFTPAAAPRRARVALLRGCVQHVLRPAINRATVRVLANNGVDVLVPNEQGCCGALAAHVGFLNRGEAFAAHNAAIFPRDVDAILTTAAGCGSAMQEYPHPAPVQDVAEFLDALGLRTRHRLPTPARVAYQDACHLAHGQRVRHAPRRVLEQVEDLTLVDLPESDLCCGSAGLYNLEQPETAAALGRRKADAIGHSGAQIVATGNIGCLTQLAAHSDVPVYHTLELLDLAWAPPE